MCMSVYMHVGMCTICMPSVVRSEEGLRPLGTSTTELQMVGRNQPLSTLETEHSSSARATHALNC